MRSFATLRLNFVVLSTLLTSIVKLRKFGDRLVYKADCIYALQLNSHARQASTCIKSVRLRSYCTHKDRELAPW